MINLFLLFVLYLSIRLYIFNKQNNRYIILISILITLNIVCLLNLTSKTAFIFYMFAIPIIHVIIYKFIAKKLHDIHINRNIYFLIFEILSVLFIFISTSYFFEINFFGNLFFD